MTKSRGTSKNTRKGQLDVSLSAGNGRFDLDTQTDPYLQEAEQKPVEVTSSAQTDPLLDRADVPATPVPLQPDRADQEVQVEDIWDFDLEVQPIVGLLVGEAIAKSFQEVHEEAEIASVQRSVAAFRAERDAELADVQRLEEAERRKQAEKERRLAQRAKAEAEAADLAERMSAKGFAEQFAAGLMMSALDQLERTGFFYDEVEREVQEKFLAWLGEEIADVNSRARLVQKVKAGVVEATVRHEERAIAAFADAEEEAYRADRKATLAARRMLLLEDLAGAKIGEALRAAAPPKPKVEEDE